MVKTTYGMITVRLKADTTYGMITVRLKADGTDGMRNSRTATHTPTLANEYPRSWARLIATMPAGTMWAFPVRFATSSL